MGVIEAWFDVWEETARREAFYSIYLAIVGAWFSWSGLKGVFWGETRGFGWRAGPALGEAAVRNGVVWLAAGVAMLALAIAFKLT